MAGPAQGAFTTAPSLRGVSPWATDRASPPRAAWATPGSKARTQGKRLRHRVGSTWQGLRGQERKPGQPLVTKRHERPTQSRGSPPLPDPGVRRPDDERPAHTLLGNIQELRLQAATLWPLGSLATGQLIRHIRIFQSRDLESMGW